MRVGVRVAWSADIEHGRGFGGAALPKPPEARDQRPGTLVTTALDAFALHGANRGGLPARQLRLRQVLRQQGGLMCMLFGLVDDAKSHPQLTHLQVGDEAVRSQPNAFAQLFESLFYFQIYAKRHPEEDAEFGGLRVSRHTPAQLRD